MSNYWSADITTGVDALSDQSLRAVSQLHQLRRLVSGYVSYANNNSAYLYKLREDLNRDRNKINAVPMTLHLAELAAEASNLSALSAALDKQVLEHINEFIKSHEPYVRGAVDRLAAVVSRYRDAYRDVTRLRTAFEEYRRLKEHESSAGDNGTDAVSAVQLQVPPPVRQKPGTSEPQTAEESALDFPLWLGPIKVSSQSELSLFLHDIVENVPTVKRSFPLPGRSPDIFSSEALCMWLSQARPFRLNPTRINLEQFGQSMLDLNLIAGSSLMGAKKFRSEGMWFEWTELTDYIENPVGIPTEPTPTQHLDMTTTTKKFNDMFKNMKLFSTDYSEKLVKLESQYNEKYYDLQELKNLIDIEIDYQSQALSKFEKAKIALIYNSLTKLAEIMAQLSSGTASRHQRFMNEFISNVNKPENYEKDFNALIEKYSTGIFNPSLLSPESFTNGQFGTTAANNNFQNVKFQFNLFDDIPLQLQFAQTDREKLLSLASLPLFIYEICRLLDEKNALLEAKEDIDLQQLWLAPLNHHTYWAVKEKLITTINSVSIENTAQGETAIQQIILTKVIDILSNQNLADLTNFFKNWLLEISDSVIPCAVYDSLLQNYSNEIPSSDETIKVLSSIPRSNLSTLVFILEHISNAFGISTIPGFGYSDEISHELKSPIEPDELARTVKRLNAMEIIGSIPLTHILLRPPITKSAKGFKPPLDKYDMILRDVLNIEVRCELFNNLVNLEKSYLSKKAAERSNLGLHKKLPMPTSPSVNSLLRSPRPQKADNFSLRPFHTKVTPVPTPNGSPRAESRTPVRDRSSSGTLLAPGINVEFEK